MTPRRTPVLAAAVVLAAGGLVTAPAAAHPRPDPAARFADRVDLDDVLGHLAELQRIADRHGSRAALTPGYEASARHVERTLRRAGYRVERDPFTFEVEVVDAASITAGDVVAGEDLVDQMTFSVATPEGGVTGPLRTPADPLGCDTAAYDGVDVTAAVVLVARGACTFAEKAVAAQAVGAAAAVVHNDVDGVLIGTLGAPDVVDIPVAGTDLATGEALRAALAQAEGDVVATLDVRNHLEERESFNVVAETRAGRDDNVVMLGAHLDGVEDGPGINDNGTGSAALLEVAVELAKERTHHNTVRFAWWGAEELGLVGSTAYVTELAETEGELDRIATYLNFDMIGSPNHVIGVYDADQSTYEAPVPVPEGSVETERVFTEYFDSIGQPWVDVAFSGRSDYQAFILDDVPASGLFTGADGVKTEAEVALFGGTAGIPYDPSYHSADDDLDNVDPAALGTMTRAIAYATWHLAQDTSAINGVRGPGRGHGKGDGRGHGHGKGHGHGHGHGKGHGHGHGKGHHHPDRPSTHPWSSTS